MRQNIIFICITSKYSPAPDGPPLNFKVIPRGTGLYFRWDAPEGSITILSYTITCYISSDLAINVTLNPVNSITLDEFMPSTTYTCSMLGSSSGGKGPSTNRVNVTTEGLQSIYTSHSYQLYYV